MTAVSKVRAALIEAIVSLFVLGLAILGTVIFVYVWFHGEIR